eukprot:NODE_1191_length_1247_cov_66.220367_g969_i0.p1 GENE.NODE_1191_length_1247_cov_66.220367_g969_i0~~NODE_1191_length_1247_cov_66.220367_g969_i0.p1  ORF type:complete len:199 (+),score=43.25 NODE_1191_length_1247_cov_66.220367_g969_i0:110-706(+)
MAACMRFIVDHYDTLPDITIFVHADIAVHNPAWLQWAGCLRNNVSFASMTPVFVRKRYADPGGGGERLMQLFTRRPHPEASARHPHSFFCCEQWAIGRDALRQYPRWMYEQAYKGAVNGTFPARSFEYTFHALFGYPVDSSPPNPCTNFRCECHGCKHFHAGLAVPHGSKRWMNMLGVRRRAPYLQQVSRFVNRTGKL